MIKAWFGNGRFLVVRMVYRNSSWVELYGVFFLSGKETEVLGRLPRCSFV